MAFEIFCCGALYSISVVILRQKMTGVQWGKKMGPDRGKKVTSYTFLIVNWRVNANSSFRQQFWKDGMLVIFFSWFQFLIWISTHSALVTKMKRKKMQPKSKAQTAKVFRDFCESTTLHGYSYLYIATSILMKIIWMIVIVSMTALGIGFVVNNTNDYLEATRSKVLRS